MNGLPIHLRKRGRPSTINSGTVLPGGRHGRSFFVIGWSGAARGRRRKEVAEACRCTDIIYVHAIIILMTVTTHVLWIEMVGFVNVNS